MNLTYEQAEALNNFIDRVHSPYYWAFGAVVAAFFALEAFLPYKKQYESRFDRHYTYFKFGLICFFALVALSQGLTGGCIIQIPQNWIAQQYMGKEYWNTPYGVVFREHFPQWFWPWLHFIYFVSVFPVLYMAKRFYERRVKGVLRENI